MSIDQNFTKYVPYSFMTLDQLREHRDMAAEIAREDYARGDYDSVKLFTGIALKAARAIRARTKNTE